MDFNKAVDVLLELNRVNRQKFTTQRPVYSPCQWTSEFCTVHCNIGRGSGKTTFIKDRVHSEKTDLVVVASEALRETYKRDFTKATLVTPNTLSRLDGPGLMKFNNIFVDEPELVFTRMDRGMFYYVLSYANMDQTFLLLGE